MLSTILSCLIAASLVLGPEGNDLLSDPKALRHFEAAQMAFNEGEYDLASRELQAAYEIEAADALLYPWAQAERFAGRCRVALDLYRRFLGTNPSETFRIAADENIQRCESELEAEAASEAEEERDGWDEVADQADLESKPAREPGEEATAREWFRDPLGGVFLGLGVAGLASGSALTVIGMQQAGEVGGASSNQSYLDARRQATNLRNGGVIALSVGGAFVVAAAVRYAILGARRRKGGSTAQTTAWMDGSGFGLAFQSRF